MEDPKLIWYTCATNYTSNLLRLRKYFDWSHEPFYITGLRDSRVQETGWKYGYKLIFLKEFVNSKEICETYKDTDILIFMDANDVLPNFGPYITQETKQEFISRFKSFDSGIVLSGMWLWTPFYAKYSSDPEKVETKRFSGICSGLFCGTLGAFRYYLNNRETPFDYCTDDEAWWRYRYMAQKDPRWNRNSEKAAPNWEDGIGAQILFEDQTLNQNSHYSPNSSQDTRLSSLSAIRNKNENNMATLQTQIRYLQESGQKQQQQEQEQEFQYNNNNKTKNENQIEIDHDTKLFCNMTMDAVDIWSEWKFDRVLGKYYAIRSPGIPLGRKIYEYFWNKFSFMPPRLKSYKAPKTPEKVTPFFLHFESGGKVALPFFSRNIMTASGLTEDNLDNFWMLPVLIVVVIIAVSLFILLLIIIFNKKTLKGQNPEIP
jgi:hypothetical protein